MRPLAAVAHSADLRRFKPYPKYRDSGVKWLGRIPDHWEVKRLRFSVKLNPPASEAAELEPSSEVSFVPMEAVGEYGGLDLARVKTIAEVQAGYTYFRDRDVVVAKITPCFENGKGARAIGLECGIAFGTTELHVIRAASAIDDSFLFYITLSDAFRRLGEAEMYGAGGQKRVPQSFVENFRQPLPPLAEQGAIASFLDRETARVDALVAKKERLIELLQEQRTSVITRVVTKGLNPTVPMKDSGVEWLGEIPAHWEVRKATWLFSIGSGTTPASDDPSYYGGETLWITTAELRESVVVETSKSVSEEALRDYSSLIVHPQGSVAVAMYGATIGRLGILGLPAAVNQACCVFSKPRLVELRFWFYWLQMARQYLISLGYGGGQPNLSQDLLRSIRAPIPPMAEQASIITILDRDTARIDMLVKKVRDAINHLFQLRTSLISAAVTGKIDVREEAE